jgi:hypothetical protein
MSRIKVDTATNKLATGPVDFPDGITGVAATFTGNVTVGGTITYDDVQNVDSVGVVTAGKGFRATTEGIVVTAGISTFNANIHLPDSTSNSPCLALGTGSDLKIHHDGSNPMMDSSTGNFYIRNTSAQFIFQAKMDENSLILKPDGAVEAYHDNSKKLETTSSGITVTGTVSDSDGTLRSLPVNSQVSAYQLVASDAGKMIKITTGGVTCPNGESFVAGDMITILNESGSSQTITEGGGATLYWTADGTNGNRTLGARGVATIVMTGSSAFYISGSGLT